MYLKNKAQYYEFLIEKYFPKIKIIVKHYLPPTHSSGLRHFSPNRNNMLFTIIKYYKTTKLFLFIYLLLITSMCTYLMVQNITLTAHMKMLGTYILMIQFHYDK